MRDINFSKQTATHGRQHGTSVVTNELVEPWTVSPAPEICSFHEALFVHAASFALAAPDAVSRRCHRRWNIKAGVAGAMLDGIGENC